MESKSDEKHEFSKYINPPNHEEIIEDIKNANMHDDVVNIINKTFPSWILGWPPKYCSDYPQFKTNWEYVCSKTNCNTLSVIIVDYFNFNDPQYSLTKLFSEILTMFGHAVRRKEEFIECKYCGSAIPNKEIFQELKKRNIPSPQRWSLKCKDC
jgi:hypothetical protein